MAVVVGRRALQDTAHDVIMMRHSDASQQRVTDDKKIDFIQNSSLGPLTMATKIMTATHLHVVIRMQSRVGDTNSLHLRKFQLHRITAA